jgi:hypothetical protein
LPGALGDGVFFLLGAEIRGGVSVKAEILKSETLKWRGENRPTNAWK